MGAMFLVGVILLFAMPVWLVVLLVTWIRITRVRESIDGLAARLRDLEQRAASGWPTPARPEAGAKAEPAVAPSSPPRQPSAPQPGAPPSGRRPAPTSPTAGAPPTEGAAPPPAPALPPPRAASASGGPLSDLGGYLWRWLLGGNTVVRVGVVVLLFGVGFFLNFAVEQGWLPVEVRLMLAAAGGLALTLVGWRLRERRRDYGLVLQGGGIGIVYLTVFAAVNLYDLVAAGPGLALMVVLVALSSALAVLQEARSLAILATLAGFLAPVIVSSGGSHVGLFSYYAVLNVGILGIAWFKAWRLLNLLGFTFTFVVSGAWGAQYYQPAYFATTEPFLVAFFLFYVAVPVLFATRRATLEARYVDGSLLFGVPLVAFGLQAGLVRDFEYGLAFSALAAGLVYVALATALWRRLPEAVRVLPETFLALGVAFGTLTIPLALDGRWTGGAWALEGAGLIWIGIRQRRWLARVSGVVLQFLAGASFLTATSDPVGDVPVFNSLYLGALLVSLAGLFSAWYLDRHRTAWSMPGPDVPAALLGWGLVWWVGGGVHQIAVHVSSADRLSAYLTFAAATSAALGVCRGPLAWRQLGLPVLLYLPVMAIVAIGSLVGQAHPFAGWGALTWGAALAVHYWLQYRLESEWPTALAHYWHAGMLWLLVFLGTRETAWVMAQLAGDSTIWVAIAWALVPGAALATVPRLARRSAWPFSTFADAYVGALAPLAVFVVGWILVTSAGRGSPAPLPYVPIVNPLELAQCLALVILARGRHLAADVASRPARWVLGSVLAFAILNGIIARGTHFLAGVDFDSTALWASARYQTTLSIVWTTAAIGAMLAARWLTQQIVWFTGAALLAAVVLKLFLVDLDGVGTVARMISFVVVGLLILVVGYLSPLPPRTQEQTQS